MKKIGLSLFTRVFLLTLGLLAFGLIMIYSASVAEALNDFGSKWYFVLLQLKWAGVGLVLMLLMSRVHPRTLAKLSPYILGFGILLLILVAIPGIGSKVQGARRWLITPFMTIQPAELIKLIEIIYLSAWLNSRRITLTQFLAFIGFVAGLIMLEPDMGTAIVVSLLAVTMYFLNGYPLKHIFTIGTIGAAIAVVLILAAPYRLARVTTFFNPENDPLGSSYHIRQVILALGSGGMTGVGIGRSRQKYEYLPESTTDSIFAVVGEELGFLGGVALIGVLAYLLSLLFRISTRAKDKFSSSLVAGIASWIGLQVILNLAAMVALAPLTGVPLPLVSYGGSALTTILLGIGIALGVARVEKI